MMFFQFTVRSTMWRVYSCNRLINHMIPNSSICEVVPGLLYS